MILKNKCRLRSVLSNPGPMAEVDNNLRDLHDSSYHTKAEFDVYIFFFKIFSKFFNILTSPQTFFFMQILLKYFYDFENTHVV